MNKILVFLFFAIVFFSNADAQVPVDTVFKKLDSLSKKTDSAGTQINNIKPQAYNDITKLNARDYFILLGSNMKQSFTKPFHMTRRDWFSFGKFAAVTIATGFADESIQQEAVKLRNNNPSIEKIGNNISKFGGLYEIYTLAGFGAYGVIFKSQKMKTTTLLATQAYITGAAVETVLKTLTGRRRPSSYEYTQESEPSFKGPFYKLTDGSGKRSNSAFPSGHSTVAFAAATIFAVEYKNKPIVPIIAYSAASLISLSRITENKHWATDVLAGAALGYLLGKQVAYNYHRFAKLKSQPKRAGGIALNLNYRFGKMMPGVVYTFR
jgi:membrane-associated phospholipid phosphatase